MITPADLRLYLDQLSATAVQSVAISPRATGGSFTLRYQGNTTDAIPFDAPASVVEALLRALPGMPSDDLRVTGPAGGPWVVTFEGASAATASTITLGTRNLTGSPAPQVLCQPQTEALLLAICERASDMVATALSPVAFGPYTTEARLVVGYGGRYLALPPHRPGSVSAVALGTTPIVDYAETEIGQLVRSGGWGVTAGATHSRSTSLVDYLITADWGDGPAPPTAVEIALEVAVNIWRSRDKGLFSEYIGVGSANNPVGGGQIRYVGSLTRQQTEMLTALKRARRRSVSV